MVQAASMVLAAGAQAQTNACDQLKAVLAARIESSGVRGYTLEAVPAGTPVPPDAKAIGTCESGARKVLYRRWGAAVRASSDSASAAAPATIPQAIAVPDGQSRRAPTVKGERTVQRAPAPTPSPAAPPDSNSNQAAFAPPSPIQAREKSMPGNAGMVEAVRAVDRAVVQPAPVNPDTTPAPITPTAQQASGFLAGNWRWIGALVLLAVAGWIWVWRAHFSAYDKAGLPRGPRL